MAIENEKLTPDQEKQLIALLDLESGLTGWEVEFLESISHQTYPLTEKQDNRLKQLYKDKA